MAKQHTVEGYYNFDYIDLGYSDSQLSREWEMLCNNDRGYDTINTHNRLIKQFQFREFYKTEISMWKANKLHQGMPLRSWLFKNRLKYSGKRYGEITQEELMRAFKVSGVYIGNSFHNPLFIKRFCKDYKVSKVYDPCGGWGHRMLGAVSAGCRYLYNDINRTATEGCMMMAAYLGIEDKVEFTSEDSAKHLPEEDYDAVFTCPPYYNVEHYTDSGAENLPYQDFLGWWKSTVSISVRSKGCRYFAFIINKTYEKDMSDIVLSLGLKLKDCIMLGNSKSHLTQNKQNYERLWVFSKT